MMNDRTTYKEMRILFLGCYYIYCKGKILRDSSWVEGENEAGYAYSELENSFETSIENLMLETIALILGGHRSDKSKEFHRLAIHEILNKKDIYDELARLPLDELAEIKSDLKILGFNKNIDDFGSSPVA